MTTPLSLDSAPLAQASAPAPARIGPDSKIAPDPKLAPAPAAAPPATAPSLLPDLRYLQNASTVGIAVEAYARGLAIKPDDITLHKAYIRKVVDLDVPQLGRAAAERVLTAEPDDGLSRAVLAFSEARRGQMVDALTNISIALKHAQNEPLVQRTAGHLLAWYDNTPNAPMLPQGVLRSVKDAQAALQPSSHFTEAYKEASDFYREQRRIADAQPATRPSTGPAISASSNQYFPEPSADLPDYAGYTGADIGYTPYAAAPSYEPSIVNNYYYDNPYRYYDYAPFWGPAFGFGFFDFDFDRDHHDRDRDHGRDRDRNREADHRFRDHFFGSSHREGTATGNHLRDIQRGVNSPMVTANRSSGTPRPGVTQISPARGFGSSSRPPSNGPRGGNAPAPHGFPAQSGPRGGAGGGFHGGGGGGFHGGGGGSGFRGGGGFSGGGMHGGGGHR